MIGDINSKLLCWSSHNFLILYKDRLEYALQLRVDLQSIWSHHYWWYEEVSVGSQQSGRLAFGFKDCHACSPVPNPGLHVYEICPWKDSSHHIGASREVRRADDLSSDLGQTYGKILKPLFWIPETMLLLSYHLLFVDCLELSSTWEVIHLMPSITSVLPQRKLPHNLLNHMHHETWFRPPEKEWTISFHPFSSADSYSRTRRKRKSVLSIHSILQFINPSHVPSMM